jgi:hypothetical protein
MSKIKEIIEGWKNFAFPTPRIEAMAMERAGVCSICEHAKKMKHTRFLKESLQFENIEMLKCDQCGCPLSAKTRSVTSQCPKNKWKPIMKITEAILIIENSCLDLCKANQTISNAIEVDFSIHFESSIDKLRDFSNNIGMLNGHPDNKLASYSEGKIYQKHVGKKDPTQAMVEAVGTISKVVNNLMSLTEKEIMLTGSNTHVSIDMSLVDEAIMDLNVMADSLERSFQNKEESEDTNEPVEDNDPEANEPEADEPGEVNEPQEEPKEEDATTNNEEGASEPE